MAASEMKDCEYTRETTGWCCMGRGYLGGDLTYGHGRTRRAANEDYLRVYRGEAAAVIEESAEEAALEQDEIRSYGGDRHGDDALALGHGTSIRDALMAAADVEAMRDMAQRLREGL